MHEKVKAFSYLEKELSDKDRLIKFLRKKKSDLVDKNFALESGDLPKVVKKLESKEPFFEAIYDDKEDLKELLNLSNNNLLNSNSDSWKKVLPLYPISPIN